MSVKLVALTRAVEYLTAAIRQEVEGGEGRSDLVDFARQELDKTCPAPRALPKVEVLYASPGVPVGWNTVLGYLSSEQPEIIDLMSDPITDTIRDGFALKNRCSRKGIAPRKVAASPALLECGITEVNAYPTSVLEDRFG